MVPDPKPLPRVRANWEGWDELRAELPAVCQLCGSTGYAPLSQPNLLYIGLTIHHLVPKSQGGDDVKDNLAVLCGHGATGCHGHIEARLHGTRSDLRAVLTPAQVAYVVRKKGEAWLDRHYPVAS